MLIINYLSALLIEGRNNQISIHKNFENKISKIRKFETEKQVTLYNLKSARDKLYAHIDLDWQKYANSITFDEFIDYLDENPSVINEFGDWIQDIIKTQNSFKKK